MVQFCPYRPHEFVNHKYKHAGQKRTDSFHESHFEFRNAHFEKETITRFYGWLRLLTWSQLTDQSLNTLCTTTMTIREALQAIR